MERQPLVVFRSTTSLYWLSAAAIALTLAGVFLANSYGFSQVLLCLWAVIHTTIVTYRFNDVMDARSLRLGVLHALTYKGLRGWTISLPFVLGTAAYFLSTTSFLALLGILTVGIAYSLHLSAPTTTLSFRLKNILGIKNALIGIGWGLLVVVGAGSLHDVPFGALALFVGAQVFIGSIIRDIGDAVEDLAASTRTIPNSWTRASMLLFLHTCNLASGLYVSFVAFGGSEIHPVFAWLLLAVLWRTVLLVGIQFKGDRAILLQSANLSTCFVILAGVLLGQWG